MCGTQSIQIKKKTNLKKDEHENGSFAKEIEKKKPYFKRKSSSRSGLYLERYTPTIPLHHPHPP